MKRTPLFLLFVLIAVTTFAQVSDSQIKKDIKSKEPSTTSIQLENAITEKEFENGGWVNYYRRMYHSVESTKWNGVTYHYYGGAQYKSTGGSYVFDKLTVGDGHYKGFKNPDKNELNNYIASNAKDFFGGYLMDKIIGDEIPKVSLVEGAEWMWHKLSSVSTTVKCIYTVQKNNTTIEKAEHTFTLRLYSDGKKAIDPSAKWTGMHVREIDNKKKVLETTTHTSDQVSAMPRIAGIAGRQASKAELESLPTIDPIPTFNSGKELFDYTHNILLTKSGIELRAYLYHLVGSNCRAGNEINMVTSYAQGFINKLVKNESNYKKTYCEYPAVKHEQSNMIELLDKEQIHMVRFSGAKEDGTWKISGIDYYPATADEAARMAANTSACSENAPAEMKEYTISEAGFTVMMPKKPVITKPGGDQNTYMMTCKHGGCEFTVTAEPLDDATVKALADAGTYQQTAINWSEQFRKAIGAAGAKNYTWEVAGTKGFQTEWRTSSSKIKFRSIILGNMYYRIFVGNAVGSKEEDQFFESFKSTNKNAIATQKVTASKAASPSFKVGTKVFVATTKGKIKARVLKVQGNKCEILYTDPRFKSAKQWVPMGNLSVQ